MAKTLKLAVVVILGTAAIGGCSKHEEVVFPTEPGNYVAKREGRLIFRTVYPDGSHFEDRQSNEDSRRLETCGVGVTSRLPKRKLELFLPSPPTGCQLKFDEPFQLLD